MRILLDDGTTLELDVYENQINLVNCKDSNDKQLKPYFDYYWDGTAVIRFEEVEK